MWTPLHLHSDSSLLDGLSKPQQILDVCKQNGYKACALTDHGVVSSLPSFIKTLSKNGIKPICGIELYLSPEDSAIKTKDNRKLSHLCLLAKNKEGWRDLIRLVSDTNNNDRYYYKPRISLNELKNYSHGNFIGFSGHLGSDLANVMFSDINLAYRSQTYDAACEALRGTYYEDTKNLLFKYMDIFGKNNFYLEIQLIDHVNLPASKVVAEILRDIGQKHGVKCIATADSHYPTKEDAEDQRILLCSALKTTLKEIQYKIDNNEDVSLGGFFKSNNYHIPTFDEIKSLHTEEEIENTNNIGDECELYDIFDTPHIPKFCNDSNKRLRELCNKELNDEYRARLNHELSIIEKANLADYFLIVQDFIKIARSNNVFCNIGRGSAGGCLVSYLLDIIMVDPIEHGLIFERFYNEGRNTATKISLPDIDCDFPTYFRPQIINYIKSKYGKDKTGHVTTFGTMQGRSVLKDVLKAHTACSFEEVNRITKYVPDEAAISDQLEQMEKPSIVMWALEHNSKHLAEWCQLDDTGKLVGRFSKYFEQAIRLEGTKRTQGKHAAAIIISDTPLTDICPMVKDKNNEEPMCGFEYGDLEEMGLVKIDILGVTAYDKVIDVCKLLRGDVE